MPEVNNGTFNFVLIYRITRDTINTTVGAGLLDISSPRMGIITRGTATTPTRGLQKIIPTSITGLPSDSSQDSRQTSEPIMVRVYFIFVWIGKDDV